MHDLNSDAVYGVSTFMVEEGVAILGDGSFMTSDLTKVIQSFLENVHSKNPILEPGLLEEAVRNYQLNGFSTDGMSALVVSTDSSF